MESSKSNILQSDKYGYDNMIWVTKKINKTLLVKKEKKEKMTKPRLVIRILYNI